ncbi:hypothetical protein B0H14DRAFT_3044141 [Mycena olivaceomarginata]|nr:hypothetical protein B0H14DRAFT_3044141 [Mycena olivaceomarginata]
MPFPDAIDAAEAAMIRRTADRARIAEIERSILVLRIEEDLVQERLDSYTYPVLTLPIEITSKIFRRFLPLYPQCPPSTGLRSPTLLTHICSDWRGIALSTPALWRALYLHLTGSSFWGYAGNRNSESDKLYRDEQNNNLLRLWMTISGSYPLSIRINSDIADIPQCLGTLALHRARWEHLHAEWISGDTPPFLGDPMPLLRQLEVLFSPDRDLVTLGNAPLLRSASVTCYTVFPITLPWPQLTSLKLRGYFWEFTPILRHTVHLVHCELTLFRDGPYYGPGLDIQIQSLQSFILMVDDTEEEDGYASKPEFLTTFILPNLHTLQCPDEFLKADFIDTVILFMSKSRCALQRLYITGKRTTTRAAYHRALPSIPEVSFYRLSTKPVDDSDEEDSESDSESEEDASDAGGRD